MATTLLSAAGRRRPDDRYRCARRRPGRADRRVRARRRGALQAGVRGRTVGGIARTVSSTATGSTSAATVSSRSSGRSRRLWEEMLGDGVPDPAAASRIYYGGKYFAYPLTAKDVVGRLGIVGIGSLCALVPVGRAADGQDARNIRGVGHGALRAAPVRRVLPFVHREGLGHSRLRDPVAVGGAADQELLAGRAILTILGMRREHVTTLIEGFRYPRLGPGQMWEALAEQVEERGIPVAPRATLHRGVARRTSASRAIVVQHGRRAWPSIAVDACSRASLSASSSSSLDPSAPTGRRRSDVACATAIVPRRADDDRGRAVPGQLDLPPRSRDARRPGPELRRLEPRHGAARARLPRRRVLLLRGRRDLERCRRARPSSGHPRARPHRSHRPRPHHGVKVRVPKSYPMYDADDRGNGQ